MASVAVIGLGTIGTIFTAHLVAGKRHEVFACVRKPVERVRVEGEYGLVDVPLRCFTEPALMSSVDFVLVATKSQDTCSCLNWLRALCRDDTAIALLQNGVEQEHRLSCYNGPGRIVPTVVYSNGRKISPQHIRHLCPGKDLLVPSGEPGQSICALFEDSLLRVHTSANFLTDSWEKYLANLVANPLSAITNRNIEVIRGGEMEQLALGVLREAAQVGRAMGAGLPPGAAENTLEWMARYPGDTGTSMLQDRKDGKPLEVEALTGTLIRLGEKLNIPTPLNRAIRAILLSLH